MLQRRDFLRLPCLAALAPAFARAAPPAMERRFLFVYANGGWDQTYVFAPLIGNPLVDMEADATLAEVNGIPFVDVEARPSVRGFFETWGHATCLLNGFEVRTIAHHKAQRLLLTGTATDGDDWGSIIASASGAPLAVPYLVTSGPSFSRDLGEEVVIVGKNGQLGALLDGSALEGERLSTAAGAAVEARVRARVDTAAAAAGRGERFGGVYARALERVAALRTIDDQLTFSTGTTFADRVDTALTCFEIGVTRAAIVEHKGVYDLGWDTHAGNIFQSRHFEQLFSDLGGLAAELAARPGLQGGSLLDEVTVVVLSDFGRHPKLNLNMGKDHWTFTSAMFFGSGIAGGRAIGAYDEYVLGERVDPASGDTSDSGVAMTSAHLGATVLALADVDPEPWLGDIAPIQAVLA